MSSCLWSPTKKKKKKEEDIILDLYQNKRTWVNKQANLPQLQIYQAIGEELEMGFVCSQEDRKKVGIITVEVIQYH